MYLSGVRLGRLPEELPEYVRRLPPVRALRGDGLRFTSPVTVFAGDNGAGKSTLLEAIAVAMGANPEGGSRNATFATLAGSVSSLHRHLTCSRRRNPSDVFFLRGETYLNLANYHSSLGPRDSLHDLPNLSHGQGLSALVERRLSTESFVVLDEPEDGLSMLRQLEIMGKIGALAEGGAQFVIASHSPIFMAIPDAQTLYVGEGGIAQQPLLETEAMSSAREFVADPVGTARYLIGEGA